MRLPRPFYQLPLHTDVPRLQHEVAALPEAAWVTHPDGLPGNSAVRLISAHGAESDAHDGPMAPTRWLDAMPALRRLLAGLGVVWSRSRLMRLAPHAAVPPHADIKHHWHDRVRLHVPIVTRPEVLFFCGDERVHMAAGEAWIFDNWRRHHVENRADRPRIHLVADTTGTAAFWRFACGPTPPRAQWPTFPLGEGPELPLLTERNHRPPVMPPDELRRLADYLCTGLAAAHDGAQHRGFVRVVQDLALDWRQLCALHGQAGPGYPDFQRLMEVTREGARRYGSGLVMRDNGVAALLVLEKRILENLLAATASPMMTDQDDAGGHHDAEGHA